MENYKEMYLKMINASEDAVRILIEAQRECEELYLTGSEVDRVVAIKPDREFSKKDEKKKSCK